jgi:hypothetical protein
VCVCVCVSVCVAHQHRERTSAHNGSENIQIQSMGGREGRDEGTEGRMDGGTEGRRDRGSHFVHTRGTWALENNPIFILIEHLCLILRKKIVFINI